MKCKKNTFLHHILGKGIFQNVTLNKILPDLLSKNKFGKLRYNSTP